MLIVDASSRKTMKKPLPVDEVTAVLLKKHPVWEFVPESVYRDETYVKPVDRLPVRTLRNRLVATRVTLANGESVLALLGNIDLRDPHPTEHFLTLSVFNDAGKRFHLARYHDADFKTRGPKQLAKFLGLTTSETFPISYDISSVARGSKSCSRGAILATPTSRLTRKQLIELALR